MQDMTISVILTKQDAKQFFFAANKKRFVIALLGYGIFIFILMFLMFRLLDFEEDAAGFFITFISSFLLFGALLFLVIFIRYRMQISEFENNKNADKTMVYTFDAQGYTVRTPKDRLSMSWKDIAKLVEYKSFFVIVRSLGKIGIIPKRCFAGTEAMNAFTDLLKACVEKRKLSIKNYRFDGFSPDFVFVEPDGVKEEASENAVRPGETPLFAFSFILTRKDILKYNFLMYYTRPGGIIATVLGLILLLSMMLGWGNGIEPVVLTNLLQSILCFLLLIFGPLFIVIFAMKSYKMDAAVKNSVTYQFFSDHIIIFTSRGINNKKVGDFRRISKRKPFYLFFLARNMAYAVHERHIDDKAAFEDYFRYIQAENKRLNSYTATNPPVPKQEPSRYCINCGAPRQSPDHMFCPECGKEYPNN